MQDDEKLPALLRRDQILIGQFQNDVAFVKRFQSFHPPTGGNTEVVLHGVR